MKLNMPNGCRSRVIRCTDLQMDFAKMKDAESYFQLSSEFIKSSIETGREVGPNRLCFDWDYAPNVQKNSVGRPRSEPSLNLAEMENRLRESGAIK